MLLASSVRRPTKKGVLTAAAVWLCLANTYWSVPYKLIESAMKLNHLPGHVQRIIGGIQIQFTVDDFATFWQRVEKGVFIGCTISPILFVMGMENLPMINSGIYQPPIRDFMDDLTVTTSTHIYKQNGSFQRWKIAFPWRVWIKFKPKMSCIKGRVNRLVKMQIQ